MDLCKMDIEAQMETVLQLQDIWYQVHSPCQFTGHITCQNASNTRLFLKPRASHFYVSPSCCLQLWDHLIISNLSNYEWELDHITFSKNM